MKRTILCGIIVVVFGLLSMAGVAVAQEDLEKFGVCNYCGMKRPMYSHSRMLLSYDDGTQVGTCSIHCLAVDLALNIDKTPSAIQVGDYQTKQLIDAESAVWVIGGQKPGVMTKRAKWAFADKAGAEAFIKENGGEIASFEQAMKASYEDMNNDTNMIRERRKAKKMQMKKEH